MKTEFIALRIKFHLLIVSWVSIFCLLYLIYLPKTEQKGSIFGYSFERGILAFGLILFFFLTIYLLIRLQKNPLFSKELVERIEKLFGNQLITSWIASFLIAGLLVSFYLFLQWFLFPNKFHYEFTSRLIPYITLLGAISTLGIIFIFPYLKKNTFFVAPGIIVVVLLFIKWFGFTEKRQDVFILYLTPLIVLSIIFISALFIALISRIQSSTIKKYFLFILLMALGVFYYKTATDYSPINRESSRFDQSAYMNFSRKVYDSGYTYTGQRNRMPFYPFLQAFLNDPKADEDVFFQRGKQINIILSLLFLSLIYIIFTIYFPNQQAVNLLLIVAFSLYLYKAAFFQAELLFYFLSFIGFLLMINMLVSPSILLGVLTGFVIALGYLTKASAFPGIIVFILFFISKELISAYLLAKNKVSKELVIKDTSKRILSLLVVVICFIAVIFPYISESKRTYTKYFYNVNSTFYMWYDSWHEASVGTRAHGDRLGWPDLPPDQIPSFSKYVNEHTVYEIMERFQKGTESVIYVLFNPYSLFNYILLGILMLSVFILLDIKNFVAVLKKFLFPILFVFIYFLVNLLLISWYIIIPTNGARFIYGLFIPFIFSIFLMIRILANNMRTISSPYMEISSNSILSFSMNFVLFLLLLEVFWHIPSRMVTDIYGW